nr:hypothetical protein Iba_chr06bCG3510 [Ipomoea batatas]GMD08734.1 hypothetical protein Iba_chr06dCG1360 [Ipomoea batatas]GMD09918.1 hypothetical protein Iba_chr06eCG1230 [Ipomoea batatas]GMD11134.1 hypothetical protein Iba_chr06fCG1430 [Ipomoea batatas]
MNQKHAGSAGYQGRGSWSAVSRGLGPWWFPHAWATSNATCTYLIMDSLFYCDATIPTPPTKHVMDDIDSFYPFAICNL